VVGRLILNQTSGFVKLFFLKVQVVTGVTSNTLIDFKCLINLRQNINIVCMKKETSARDLSEFYSISKYVDACLIIG